MIRNCLLLCVILVGLVGCEKEVKTGQTTRSFEITALKKPVSGKHGRPFRVWLRDVETGRVYERVRVSRRCSGWRKVQVGSRVKLVEATYKSEKGRVRTAIENAQVICPGH